MKNYLYYIYWRIRTIPFRWNFPKYNILSFEETVRQIIEERKSISRFGDGEFRLLIKERDIVFQKLDDEIAERLYEVINSDLPNLLVAIPYSFRSVNNLKRDVLVHWLNFINLKGKEISKKISDKNKIFGDALISRFYISYNKTNNVQDKVNILKNIWKNKDLLIVEGEFSRLGVGNDFFDNAKSIKRILCPQKNAFEKYEEILKHTKHFGKDKLIIIALGPTATVLSYDLAKENFWALDLGHIDIEYSWYLANAKTKIPVKGKKSAEVSGDENFDLTESEKKRYENSILARIL